MFSISENDTSISIRFSSSMVQVDRVICSINQFVGNLEKNFDISNISTVTRELLVNAVEHGNCGDTMLESSVVVERIGDGRYRIAVSDEGCGVDPELLLNIKPLDNSAVRKRGLAIANVYADQLVSEPEHQMITAYVSLKRDVLFNRTEQDGTVTIAPRGDITASVAERFRKELLAWYDSGNRDLILDMKNAGDIDSVCLSVIVSLCKMAGVMEKQRTISLANASEDFVNLIILTRLNRLINIIKDTVKTSESNQGEHHDQ